VAGILAIGVLSTGTANPVAPGGTGVVHSILTGIPHSSLYGLSFAQSRGIAVGARGAIFETLDAGANWTRVPDPPTHLALLSVATRGDHAIAVGQTGVVAVSEGKGKWTLGASNSTARLLVVDVNSAGLAVAAGEFGTVLKSTDAGRTWAPAAPDWSAMADKEHFGTGEPTIFGAVVNESGQITLAGEFGVIVRSDDAGATWRVLRAVDPQAPTLHALFLQSPMDGNSFAVGQKGELLSSLDGGETWGRIETHTELNFLGVSASATGEVVISGMRVMMRSTNCGLTWESVEEGDTTTDWYQAVRTEPGSGKIYAVGHSGKIVRVGV
jgi:photosystem II stability/assembly factor-like uncharacterized protein